MTQAERAACKAGFHVDPFFVDLNESTETLVRWSCYWYGMWSHRRDLRWKGYVEVELSAAEDATAGGHPINPSATGGVS